LLGYSVRRGIGALLVSLVVIWLLQFGVYHIAPQALRGITIFPDGIEAWIRAQPGLAHEWNVAAFEVGAGLLALLWLGALWRLRKRSAV